MLGTDALLSTPSTFSFENGETITGLSENTTYYWQIVTHNCFGSTSSSIWSFTTGTTASVNDYDSKLFTVFPNPVVDILSIEGNAPIDNIEVINQLGQSVITFERSSIINNTINLNKLNTGIYFIRLKSNDTIETLQIIKQ